MSRPCKEIKRCSRENLTHHYSIPMGALLVAGFIPLAIELPFSMTIGENPTLTQQIILLVADFLIALIGCILSAGLSYLHLNLVRRKPYQMQMVFWGFKNRPDRFILATLGQFICMLPGLVPLGIGIGLLYIPELSAPAAILMATVLALCSLVICVIILLNLTFLINVVLDHPEFSLVECFRYCLRSMDGHRGKLLYMYLSFLGLDLLCVVSLGIGSLWVQPYKAQTFAGFYLDITGDPLPANTIDIQI